ncbi:hypothetical protein HEP73_02161 [Xanthomonas sp. GW]|uniref:hypothetical protein n=1 Tax=Xanthomonas sp. GW TaxID=2724121 RepID=UPI00163A41C2|nr:hypothetical protein [Xanthomonas sp. GW]QNH21247.1 hypothetical protein HEP73_02161 [Xanthomonas sp. GW]
MSEKPEPVVFHLAHHLSEAEMGDLAANFRKAYGDRMVIVLPPGITKSDSEQLDRIERQLGVLINALAAEGEEEREAPITTLDGDVLPGDRDQTESLG